MDPTRAVELLAHQMSDAWNRRDSVAFAAPFSEDAEFSNVEGERFLGRKTIAERHQRGFSGPYRSSVLSTRVRRVRPLEGTMVSADVEWILEGAHGPNGEPRLTRRGLLNWVVARVRSHWVIVVSHNSEFWNDSAALLPGPATPSGGVPG